MRCSGRDENLLEQILDYLFGNPKRERRNREEVSLRLQVRYQNGNSVTGENMTTLVRVDEIVSFVATVTDKFGNAVAADGSASSWFVSDESLATIVPSADGASAVVTPTGKLGTVTVNATVGGVSGSADVDLTAGAPASVVLTATVSTPAPAAVPAAAEAPAAPADQTTAPATGTDTTTAPADATAPTTPTTP